MRSLGNSKLIAFTGGKCSNSGTTLQETELFQIHDQRHCKLVTRGKRVNRIVPLACMLKKLNSNTKKSSQTDTPEKAS